MVLKQDLGVRPLANGNKNLTAFDDYYSTMLEAEPQMAYMGQLASTQFRGTDPMQKRAQDYFGSQFGDVYNKYLGVKGREMKNRTDPSKMTSFTDYLEKNPFTDRYSALTPQQRGESTRRFAPSTRFIFF